VHNRLDGTKRKRLTRSLLTVTVLSAGLAACGSTGAGVTAQRAESASSTETTPDTVSPPPTVETTPDSTDPATTEPATTVLATTPPPTEAPTTTTAGVPAGWRHVDHFPDEVFPPFDESNWTGVPSPAITTPLADGIYAANVTMPWNAAHPHLLDISLQQLVPCTALPADSCLDTGSPYGPNDMGLSSELVSMTIPLDSSIGVGLTGYDCDAVDALGNGADLAALLSDFDAAYTATIAPTLAGANDAAATLNAAPANGFSGIGGSCGPDGFSVVFHDGDAPPLLLQTLSYPAIDSNGNAAGRLPLTPTDVVHLDTVQVVGGVMTFYFYAGFYS
jgi:hypothetical protein